MPVDASGSYNQEIESELTGGGHKGHGKGNLESLEFQIARDYM